MGERRDADLIRVEKRGGEPALSLAPSAGAVDANAIRFRVSNEDVDALGDVVVQAGLDFPPTLPAVADHSHTLQAAIGDWQQVERGNRETFATLRLLPRGVSRSADLVRAMHEGGFPLASSIFFTTKRGDVEPITRSTPGGRTVETGGVRYLRGKVHEITLTQFPANPAAVAVARSLGFSDAELAALSRPAPDRVPVARTTSAVAGAPRPRGTTMTIAEMIAAAQVAHDNAQATLGTATQALEADQSEANLTAVQRATSEVESLFARLTTYRAAEAASARRAAATPPPGQTALPPAAQTAVSRAVGGDGGNRAAAIIASRGEPQRDPPGTYLARLCMAAMVARTRRQSLDAAAAEVWAGDREVLAIARAAVGVADTTTAGWAAELVRTETRGLLDQTLMPNSIWPQLAAAGTSMNFGGAHSILIPQLNVGMTSGGAWVGEGGVIPLVQGAFTSKRLFRYKLAGIIPITKELQRTSDPDAVAAMREMLRQFLSNLLDSCLIDTSPEVAGVRPAGLLNGVTPIAGTAGGGYGALQGDLEAISKAFTAAGVGTNPYLLVPQSKTFRLATMVNALGQLVFPSGTNAKVLGFVPIPSQFIPEGTAIAVAAEKFVSAIDALEFDSSEEATLTLADAGAAAPTQAGAAVGGGALGTAKQVIPDGGIPVAGAAGASAAGVIAMSMFQTWSLALRSVIPASFAVTRAGAVQEVTGITW
jgi:HK97 family phage major capsid protein